MFVIYIKWEEIQHKPAKFRPAFLQATAVIIMCEPSRECTKFGGKAVLCRLTMTYESETKKKIVIKRLVLT